MKVKIILLEASPNTLWTHGEVKHVSAPGHPSVAFAEAMLRSGSTFIAQPGLHAYSFLIKGDGSIKMQAVDSAGGTALAPPASYDTSDAHGGHTYAFNVS